MACLPSFFISRASSRCCAGVSTAMSSAIRCACARDIGRILFAPARVRLTSAARRSVGCGARLTKPCASSRSTLEVIEPLVSSTFAPMTFTGSGPEKSRSLSTAKSESTRPAAAMLSCPWRSSQCAALRITSAVSRLPGLALLLKLPGEAGRILHEDLVAGDDAVDLVVLDAELLQARAEGVEILHHPRGMAAGRRHRRVRAGHHFVVLGDQVELHLVLRIAEPRAAWLVAHNLVQPRRSREELEAEHVLVEVDAGIEVASPARHALVHHADPFHLRKLLVDYACHRHFSGTLIAEHCR